MVDRPAKNGIISILLVMVVLLSAACMGGGQGTATVQPAPTRTTTGGPTVPTREPTMPPTQADVKNTLMISEPLRGATIVDTVEVKGEGMAFENRIMVEVVANG